jgi:hypothetical protein
LTIRTLLIDLRYGGSCGGTIPSRFEHLGAGATQSTGYDQLDEVFRRAGIRVDPADVLVDIGCGKGRVINYWLGRGYRNRMVGLELDPEFADGTRRRLRSWPNVEIIAGDAVDNLPEDGTIFYAFNPFGTAVMTRLKAKMEDSLRGERDIVLLYYNCHQTAVFQGDPAWRVESLGEVGPWSAVLITLVKNPRDRGAPAPDSSCSDSTRPADTSASTPDLR